MRFTEFWARMEHALGPTYAAVWASHTGWQTEATVTEHVYRLRHKIEADPRRPRRGQ